MIELNGFGNGINFGSYHCRIHFTFQPLTTMAKQAPLTERIAAMIAAEAAKQAPKATTATPAAPRVKGRDIAKATSMLEKGHKMIADALAILNQKEEKPEAYTQNVTKYPEIAGAYFGRDGKGLPMMPSGKLANDTNKAAYAKGYPELHAAKQQQKEKKATRGGNGAKPDTKKEEPKK